MEFIHTLYINGVCHRATGLSGRVFVDSAEMPCRPCSQHTLPDSAELHMKHGARIKTSGNWYSLSPGTPDA